MSGLVVARTVPEDVFRAAVSEAQGILDAAIAEVELLADDVPVADESGISSQAVIFTEDRIRKWAGRPVGEVGKDLAIAIFGKSGQFQMGQTDGEMEGWHLFAQGITRALRNVDAHRIQDPTRSQALRPGTGRCMLSAAYSDALRARQPFPGHNTSTVALSTDTTGAGLWMEGGQI